VTRAPLPQESSQIAALTRSFLARFFDNEMTGGSSDLQHAFFWLLAALATPGLVMPTVAGNGWNIMALAPGPEGGLDFLRMQASANLTFSIGVTMVGIGLMAAVSWQSLLLERRDVQVLGTFPVRYRTVLIAKLCSLVLFFLILVAATAPLSAVCYGLFLGTAFSVPFGFRVAGLHVLVSTLAALASYLAVIGFQGLVLSVAGPRLFTRVAPLLQLLVVAMLGLLFLSLPAASTATLGRLYAIGPTSPDWVLWMPTTWFYGIYAKGMGVTLPIMDVLIGRAMTTTVALLAIVLVTYPLSYRRLIVDALIGVAAPARRSLPGRGVAAIPALLSASPVAQATLQFTMTTIGRVGVHRLVMSMAVGAAMAIIVPLAAANLGPAGVSPAASVLAIPIVLMTAVLIGLRITYAMPAELGAAWLFRAAAGQEWAEHRIAARRLMLVAGVLLPIAITVPVFGSDWGVGTALLHSLVCAALGALITEGLLIDFDGVPCSAPFEPGRAQLESRWPWYLAGMNIAMLGIPINEAELLITGRPLGLLVIAGVFAVNTAIVRRWSEYRRPEPVTQESPGPASFRVLLR